MKQNHELLHLRTTTKTGDTSPRLHWMWFVENRSHFVLTPERKISWEVLGGRKFITTTGFVHWTGNVTQWKLSLKQVISRQQCVPFRLLKIAAYCTKRVHRILLKFLVRYCTIRNNNCPFVSIVVVNLQVSIDLRSVRCHALSHLPFQFFVTVRLFTVNRLGAFTVKRCKHSHLPRRVFKNSSRSTPISRPFATISWTSGPSPLWASSNIKYCEHERGQWTWISGQERKNLNDKRIKHKNKGTAAKDRRAKLI